MGPQSLSSLSVSPRSVWVGARCTRSSHLECGHYFSAQYLVFQFGVEVLSEECAHLDSLGDDFRQKVSVF